MDGAILSNAFAAIGGFPVIIAIGLILIAGFILLRKLFSAMFLDVIQFVLSYADEFLLGFMGLDWGDWISAAMIYWYLNKKTGKIPAFAAAVVAGNPIPGLDLITNFVPITTIMMACFSKEGKARGLVESLQKKQELARRFELPVNTGALKTLKRKLSMGDYVAVVDNAKNPHTEVNNKLIGFFENEVDGFEYKMTQFLEQEGQKRAPPELLNPLAEGFSRLNEAYIKPSFNDIYSKEKEPDFHLAFEQLDKAKQTAESYVFQYHAEIERLYAAQMNAERVYRAA